VFDDARSRVSMKKDRFGTWNRNTIGLVLYSNDEIEIMKSKFSNRQGSELPEVPKSKKYKKRKTLKNLKKRKSINNEVECNADVETAIVNFLKELEAIDVTTDHRVKTEDLISLLEKPAFLSAQDVNILFNNNIRDTITTIDGDNDGKITYDEVIAFVEEKGIDLHAKRFGHTRRAINGFYDCLQTVRATLYVSLLKSYIDDRDSARTIGINTGYIETADFDMGQEDKDYLQECGSRATRAYLREYCKENNLLKNTAFPFP